MLVNQLNSRNNIRLTYINLRLIYFQRIVRLNRNCSDNILRRRIVVTDDDAINRRLEDVHLVLNLVHQLREVGIPLAAVLREDGLVLVEPHNRSGGCASALVLELVLVQGGIVVRGQRIVARPSRHSGMATTLPRSFIAHRTERSTNVTAAVLAPEQAAAEQIEGAVLAFAARSAAHGRLAGALAGLRVARVQGAHRTVHKALALLAAVRIRYIQVPIQRLALVTNATGHPVLALAQFAHGHRSTSSKPRNNAGRIAITLLADGIIVEALFALVARFAIEVLIAQALAVRIAGQTIRAVRVTVAGQTLRILVVAGAARGALTAREIGQAWTLSAGIAIRRHTAGRGTIAGHTVGIVVVAGQTLVTPRSTEALSAHTLSVRLVANLLEGATDVTVTI